MSGPNAPVERRAGRLAPVAVVVLLVTGVLVGAGAAWVVLGQGDDEEVAAVSTQRCGPQTDIALTVSPPIREVVETSLEEVTPECTRVTTSVRSGIEVAAGVGLGGAQLPDVWIPEASYLTTPAYLGPNAPLRLVSRSVAHTPVLLVGGKDAQRFASWGEAEASGRVSLPDPETSVAGTLAVVAPQAEARAVGRSMPDAQQMVVPFAQVYGARRARGVDTEVWPEMFPRTSTRLVVATEQEMTDVEGREDLRDHTPAVGAPALDFPVAVREGAPRGARALARALVTHLTGEDGAARLRAEGLRAAGDHAAPGSVSRVSRLLPTPPAKAINATVASWRTLAVPSAILAVVDASGSMDFDAGGGTRMDLLSDAAGIGLASLPGHARVGLWIFSIDKGGPGQDWRELEPIRRLDDLRFGRTQRFALRQRAEELSSLTGGGTGLYDTALAAYRKAVRSYRPHYSNAVVLMTDGQNEDPGSIDLDQLLDRLAELRDPERPVRLVGIAISGDADLDALRRMAHVTGGEAYLAAEPQDILEVFARAVLSR
jgi:Mg-chelatase subunit ChlD